MAFNRASGIRSCRQTECTDLVLCRQKNPQLYHGSRTGIFLLPEQKVCLEFTRLWTATQKKNRRNRSEGEERLRRFGILSDEVDSQIALVFRRVIPRCKLSAVTNSSNGALTSQTDRTLGGGDVSPISRHRIPFLSSTCFDRLKQSIGKASVIYPNRVAVMRGTRVITNTLLTVNYLILTFTMNVPIKSITFWCDVPGSWGLYLWPIDVHRGTEEHNTLKDARIGVHPVGLSTPDTEISGPPSPQHFPSGCVPTPNDHVSPAQSGRCLHLWRTE